MANVHGWTKTAWRKTNEKKINFSLLLPFLTTSHVIDSSRRVVKSWKKNLQIFSVSYVFFTSLEWSLNQLARQLCHPTRNSILFNFLYSSCRCLFVCILSLPLRRTSTQKSSTVRDELGSLDAKQHKNMMRDEGEKWVFIFFSRQSHVMQCVQYAD